MRTLDDVINEALRFHARPENGKEWLYINIRDFIADKIIEVLPTDSTLDDNKILKQLYDKLTVRKADKNAKQ